jgi:hypothetical protein
VVEIWRYNRVKQKDKKWLITMIALTAWDFSLKIVFRNESLNVRIGTFSDRTAHFPDPSQEGETKA